MNLKIKYFLFLLGLLTSFAILSDVADSLLDINGYVYVLATGGLLYLILSSRYDKEKKEKQ